MFKPVLVNFWCGHGQNRTGMRLPSAVFETAASTCSATRPIPLSPTLIIPETPKGGAREFPAIVFSPQSCQSFHALRETRPFEILLEVFA